MSTLLAPARTDPFTLAQQKLAREVEALEQVRNSEHVYRLSVPIPFVEPLRWLAAQTHAIRLYWSGREEDREVAAVGAAHLLHGNARRDIGTVLSERRPADHPDARYYGGLRFDAARPVDAVWKEFEMYGFVLPRFEVVVEDGEAHLACNICLPQDRGRLREIAAQARTLAPMAEEKSSALPLPVSRQDTPDRAGWMQNVEQALRRFEQSVLEKVVLARTVVLGFDEPLDPVALLLRLKAATLNCFHFFFQPHPGLAFVGATPERLYRREGLDFRSEAVAGTRPRGLSSEADARLGRDLLNSEKDQREHDFVRQSISRRLGPLTSVLDVAPSARLMKLAKKQHLVSPIRATLCPGVNDGTLLRALHPTPAVGGSPTEPALQMIRETEPFDRGWYTGPVGWIGPDAAEFAVAIRCGLVQNDELALYSGAGIVAGSEPEAEWEEVEHKISDFVNVLTAE